MSAMSDDSDVLSSELDDIELARPARPVYEHDTDVPALFGGHKARGNQQWTEPLCPRRGDDQDRQKAVNSVPVVSPSGLDDRSGFVGAPRLDTARARAMDANGRFRMEQDSGAALDSTRNSHSAMRGSESRVESYPVGALRPQEGSSSLVVVDLLAHAFTLNEHAWRQGAQIGRSPAEVIRQRAVAGLDVDPSAIRFFELREVQASDMRPSGRYAVSVDRSGFTLQDMEDLLADNRRMQDITSKSTASLESIQGLLRQFDADKSRLHLQCAEHKAEVRRVMERCRIAESYNNVLRSQLQRCEDARSEYAKEISKMRGEWDQLHRSKPKRSVPTMPLSARRPVTQPGHTSQHPVRSDMKPLSARGVPKESLPPGTVRGSSLLYEQYSLPS